MAKPDPFHAAAEALTERARSNFERQLDAANARAAARVQGAQQQADSYWMEATTIATEREGFFASLLAGFFGK